MRKKDEGFKYFVRLLGLTNTDSERLDGGDYLCVGSRYHYHSKPIFSPISAILGEKAVSRVGIKAKTISVLGDPLQDGDPLAKYLSGLGIAQKITKIEESIQKIFGDNIKDETKRIDAKTAILLAPDYKAEQGKIGKILAASAEAPLNGGGNIKTTAAYTPANIYAWKKENFGVFGASFEASISQGSTVAKDVLAQPIVDFFSNSILSELLLSIEGIATLERNSQGDCNIFIKKI